MADQVKLSVKVSVFIAMNENGDYGVGCDEDAADAELSDNIGRGQVQRMVQIDVWMTAPELEKGPDVSIPDTAGRIEHVEVASG